MVTRTNRRPKGQKKRNGNGNGKARGTTTRQKFRVGSNGLSSQGAIRRPMINKKFVESGSDFLGTVTVIATPTTVASRVLATHSISPSSFPGTRLTQLSNLWERYRFRKFRIRWVPAVPKTLACQFIIYQDTDPLDDPTGIATADALIRQATAQAGSQQFNFINAVSIDLARRSDDQLYYTGPTKTNERFTQQGTFYVIQITNPLNFNGEALEDNLLSGSIYVDWVCEFQVAQINPTAVVSALFTDWASLVTHSNLTVSASNSATFAPGTYILGTILVPDNIYFAARSIHYSGTAATGSSITLNLVSTAAQITVGRLEATINPGPANVSLFVWNRYFKPDTYNVSITVLGTVTLKDYIAVNYITSKDSIPVFTPA